MAQRMHTVEPPVLAPRDYVMTLRDKLAARAATPLPRRVRSQNIGNTERAATVAIGATLALLGLSRRSWTGAVVAGLGAALAYRGIRGYSKLYRRMGIRQPDAPVEIVESVTIQREPHEVYAFWRKLENLPRFMRYLRSVDEQSETRSHWIAQSQVTHRAIEWDAEITEDVPNELIRWRSMPDRAGFQHAGVVRFRRAPAGRGTEVHIHMVYRPPLGIALAALTFPFSKQILQEEIRRLKRVLEAGEIPTTMGQPSGRHH